MRIPSRLHRNRHGVFGIRLVLPPQFRAKAGRREIRVTLRTCERRIAVRLARHLSPLVDRFTAALPAM
ncbi:MAG TPA: DUF6538 domain-containing protein, partial [Casimicrobiaceae bacterium]|nr:DUF6538 domain-containing protein [Casimicrobiaceae bacterium]